MIDRDARRRFLAAFAGSSLLPGVLWARFQESGEGLVNERMLADAARVAGSISRRRNGARWSLP